MRIFMLTMLTPFNSASVISKIHVKIFYLHVHRGRGGLRVLKSIKTSTGMPGPACSTAASVYLCWLALLTFTAVGCSKPFCLKCVNGPTTAGAAGAGQLGRGRGFGYKQQSKGV